MPTVVSDTSTESGASFGGGALSPHPDLVLGSDGLMRPSWAAKDELLRQYYDTEWGNPIYGEQELFEKLCLESLQSGLSWRTILVKRPALREAFANFQPDLLLSFGEDNVTQLMGNSAIIRNRAKILAIINNAHRVVQLRARMSLSELIWSYKPSSTPRPMFVADIPTQSEDSLALAKALKKEGFQFIGPTTAYALMESIGMVDTHLVGSYRRGSSGIWPESLP